MDVVFDGVGGETGRAAYDLLGPGGRFVPYGAAAGSTAVVLPAGSRCGIEHDDTPQTMIDYARNRQLIMFT